MKGYIDREISKRKYNRSCRVVYLPEKQRLDDTIIIEQEKDNFDRNFKNPLDDQFKESEISRIITDKKNELIQESSLYPERGSRVDPYY
tara:strand:- start:46 stop:312 length:267 start_codon:yes stop_codon:yes gene_type:complete